MQSAKALPAFRFGSPRTNSQQLNLSSRSALLRDKVRLLRVSTRAPQEVVQQIDNHLNAISQESVPMEQWSHYELAYEEYIAAAPQEDLLGILLNLRLSVYLLDASAQEVWSGSRLTQMEQELKQGTFNASIRGEIASLARAVYQSEMRRQKDSDLRRNLVVVVLALNAFFAMLVIGLLVTFQLHRIGPISPWQLALLGCLGASGSMLSSSFLLERFSLNRDGILKARANLFFRATAGALLGVMVSLFFQLRIVDFPFLHIGAADTTPFAPAALYIFSFVTGAVVGVFYGKRGEFTPKRLSLASERAATQEAPAIPEKTSLLWTRKTGT